MSNTKGKVNPTVSQVHRPNLPQAQGKPNDANRSHIQGPAKSTERAKA
jgi:hypothetical protein